MLVINGLVGINRYGDTSAGKHVHAVVIGKHITHERHGDDYKVTVTSPVLSPLPFKSGSTEDFTLLDHGAYLFAIVGKCYVELKIHPGFLGFPWYDHNFMVVTPSSLNYHFSSPYHRPSRFYNHPD